MIGSLKKIGVAVLVSVAAFLPLTAAAQVSKFALSVEGKDSYTITASLAANPLVGQKGEFTGTLVFAGTLPPAADNFTGGFNTMLGVAFSRLDDDTIKVVDAKGNKFWVIIKGSGTDFSATISDGVDTIAKAQFRGVWHNDTGEAGAQSIPTILASMVAQQVVPSAPTVPIPTAQDCIRMAKDACLNSGGLASVKWSVRTCEFTCLGFARP